MKKLTRIAGLVAMTFACAQTLQAVPVTGAIGFTGGATIDTSSMATATEVKSWIGPIVTLDSGAFSSVPLNTAVSISSPWNFNSGAISDFWTVGGFTFNLLGSVIEQQGGTPGVNGFVVVEGTGTVSGNGYSTTTLIWNFTSQDPKAGSNPDSWTFGARAASADVPDGGATVMLLGLAVSGLALLKKKLMA